MVERKMQKCVNVKIEIDEEVKARGLNFSGLVNELLSDYLLNENEFANKDKFKLEKEMKYKSEEFFKLQSEISKLNRRIKAIDTSQNIKKQKDILNKLQDNEHNFFSEALEPLTKNPAYIEGQIKRYNLEFQRKITEEQFWKKFEQYKEVVKNGKN